MKKFLSVIFVALLAFVLIGCHKPETTPPSISITGKNSLTVGDTQSYSVKFTPENYADKSVRWSSSDETVLTVDQKGNVTALAASDEGVYIYATSTKDETLVGRKRIKVRASSSGGEVSYPDLGGYTIKIAHAQQSLAEFDPFLGDYTQSDKEFKQEAWNEVEEDFNCTIQVVAYPDYAPWGPPRWAYIKEQAEHTTADFDFYTIPDMEIPGFVESECLLPLDDYYAMYGQEKMDPTFITSGSYKGHLYSMVPYNGGASINNVMYYNLGLYEELHNYDATLPEPAQLFLDGEWTYTRFSDYCTQAYNIMKQKYGEAASADKGTEQRSYYVISGWPTYWFVGFAGTDGDPIANLTTMNINLDSPHRIQAIELVKTLWTADYADSAPNVDQSVVSWAAGKALFDTGDLWFVKNSSRWGPELWGKGETKYGYVPWPMPDDMKVPDDPSTPGYAVEDNTKYKIALSGTSTWVMPRYRDYSDYGPECTPENIYRAVMEMMLRSQDKFRSNPNYDAEALRLQSARHFADSEPSQTVYLMMQDWIEQGRGYFDPLVSNDNPIGTLYGMGAEGNPTTLRAAVDRYRRGQINTWSEAISSLVPTLKESMIKAYS